MEGENYSNFDIVVSKMRKFFKDVKGFREVHPQNKKSILAMKTSNVPGEMLSRIH